MLWPNWWPKRSGHGEIGKHKGLKILRFNRLPGSSPGVRTKNNRLKIECLFGTPLQLSKKLFTFISLIKLIWLLIIVTLVQLVFNLGHYPVALRVLGG